MNRRQRRRFDGHADGQELTGWCVFGLWHKLLCIGAKQGHGLYWLSLEANAFVALHNRSPHHARLCVIMQTEIPVTSWKVQDAQHHDFTSLAVH